MSIANLVIKVGAELGDSLKQIDALSKHLASVGGKMAGSIPPAAAIIPPAAIESAKQLEKAAGALAPSMQAVGAEAKAAASEAGAAGRKMVETGAKAEDLGSKLDDTAKHAHKFGAAHADAFHKMKMAAMDLQMAGMQLTMGLTAPIAGIGIASSKASMDFNKAMADIGSLIPGNTARVLELKGSVQEMAVDFGKSTDDLAGGLYQVISAFGDGADTAKVLGINAKAAAAGLATTTDAINLTSAVTKGYGDTSAAAVQKASDLAFQTVKLGQTSFPQLAASIGRVVPLASALGVKQEELFGVMATATGVTGDAAEVSTQLRGALQALLAPTDNTAKLMKAMGFSSGEAMIKQLGLQGAITTLTQAAKQSGQPLQTFIGSIEGQTIALALAGPQADTLTKKMAAMQSVAGETDRAFKEQTQGINKVGFAWSQFTSKVSVVAQKLGDELAPVLMDTITALKPTLDVAVGVAKAFGALPAPIKAAVVGVAAVVAALGPLLVVAGGVMTVVGSLAPLFVAAGSAAGGAAVGLKILSVGANVAGVALKAMLGPIGVVAIGLGIIAAKAKETNEEWDKALKRQEESLGRVGSAVSNASKIWTQFSKGVKISAVDAKQGAVGLRLIANEATDPAMAKALREKATALLQYAESAAKAAGKADGKVAAPAFTIPNIDFGGDDKGESPAEKIKKTLEDLPGKMKAVATLAGALGSSFDANSERASILRAAITALVENGLNPKSVALKKLIGDLGGYQSAISSAAKAAEKAKALETMLTAGMAAGPKILNELDASLKQISASATLFGDKTGGAAQQQERVKGAIEALIPIYGKSSQLVAGLKQQYDDLGKGVVATNTGFAVITQSASNVFQAINALKDGLATITEAFGVQVSDAAMKAIASMTSVGLAVVQVASAIPVLIPQLIALGGAMWAALGPIGVIVAGLVALAAAAYLVWKAFQDDGVTKAMEGLKKSMADISAQSAVMGDSFDRDGAVIKAYEGTLIELAKAGKQNTTEFKSLKRAYDGLRESAKEAAKAAENLKAAIDLSATLVINGSFVEKLKAQLAEATQDYKDYQEAWRKGDAGAAIGIQVAGIAMKKLNKEIAVGSSLMGGMGSALQGAIKNFLMGTGNLTRGLKEGIKEAIISAITEAALQGAIVKGAFGGLLESLTTGLANGSDVSGIIAQIGAAIPQVAQQLEASLAPLRGAMKGFGRAPAMAAGGIVTGPTMALVGEGASDEAVLPLTDSTFQRMGAAIASAMPQRSVQSQQGNQTINITINAGASVLDEAGMQRFARLIGIQLNTLRAQAT